jgi:glycosyltransferase involved in cell wall biosynthesis
MGRREEHRNNMKLTIGIKALNEESNIASSLTSALAVLKEIEGEVILADSGSQDKTIEIAKQFPVRIVQLGNPADRSCGASAQLAYQYCGTEYFYMLDADMVVHSDFMVSAIRFLEANLDVAGVGGRIRERNLAGEDFQIRAQETSADAHRKSGIVDRLDCGGLYRTAALRKVGYFADRNLHSFEELDLALRLNSCGWRLERIDLLAVDHFGHEMGGYSLLWRRLRSGYAFGVGEIMQAAWSNGQFANLVKRLGHVRHCCAVLAWWFALCVSVAFSLWLSLPLALLPAGFLIARRRSVKLGIYTFAAWNLTCVGMLAGLLQKRIPPLQWVPSVELEWGGEDTGREGATNSKSQLAGGLPPDQVKTVAGGFDGDLHAIRSA